jgi:hypothetical protein
MALISTPSSLQITPTGFLSIPSSLSTTDLITVHSLATDLDIDFSEPSNGLDHSTAKSIYNAWMETAIIDNYGMVWVLPDRLSEILRTSKTNAKYIVAKIGKQYKSKGAAGTYLHYAEIQKRLSQIITSAGTTKKEKYAGFSESIGMAIRDSAKARYQRAQTYEAMSTAKKGLKQKRVRQLQIGCDELTGVPLLPTSQFSHIRSCAIYPQFTACVWNGLVVNKHIHQIITDTYINDEDELYDLCRRQEWSTEWYDSYVRQVD